MKKIVLNNVVLAVAVLLAAGTYSFAQTPATPEQRAAAEAAMTAVSRYLYPFLIMFTHLYVRIQPVFDPGDAAAYAVDLNPLSVL